MCSRERLISIPVLLEFVKLFLKKSDKKFVPGKGCGIMHKGNVEKEMGTVKTYIKISGFCTSWLIEADFSL